MHRTIKIVLNAVVGTALAIACATQARAEQQFLYLRADDPNSRINIREYPSTGASAPHYGLPGDRVEVLETSTTTNDGFVWYKVRFPESQAVGWVRGDLGVIDYGECPFDVNLGGFNCH